MLRVKCRVARWTPRVAMSGHCLYPITLTDKLLKTSSFLQQPHFTSLFPPREPSSRELAWRLTVRSSQNINKLCYKWIILLPFCNTQLKKSHDSWEWLFRCFPCAEDNTGPLIAWITHYNVYSLPSVVCVSEPCSNPTHLGMGLDAECARSWPPRVTLYAGGLKINRNKTKTHSAI